MYTLCRDMPSIFAVCGKSWEGHLQSQKVVRLGVRLFKQQPCLKVLGQTRRQQPSLGGQRLVMCWIPLPPSAEDTQPAYESKGLFEQKGFCPTRGGGNRQRGQASLLGKQDGHKSSLNLEVCQRAASFCRGSCAWLLNPDPI